MERGHSTLGGPLLQPPPVPVFCDLCQTWLRGQSQWEVHVVGRKHRVARARLQPRSFTDVQRVSARGSARSALLLVYIRCSSTSCPASW
eukprot:3074318-Lingulodinium_polyedra.AAC.1